MVYKSSIWTSLCSFFQHLGPEELWRRGLLLFLWCWPETLCVLRSLLGRGHGSGPAAGHLCGPCRIGPRSACASRVRTWPCWALLSLVLPCHLLLGCGCFLIPIFLTRRVNIFPEATKSRSYSEWQSEAFPLSKDGWPSGWGGVSLVCGRAPPAFCWAQCTAWDPWARPTMDMTRIPGWNLRILIYALGAALKLLFGSWESVIDFWIMKNITQHLHYIDSKIKIMQLNCTVKYSFMEW